MKLENDASNDTPGQVESKVAKLLHLCFLIRKKIRLELIILK